MKEIGQKLKTAREEMGLSLNEVSQKTKIRSLYLQAIEEGNLDRIPGIVYAKGFIKAYAIAVGLDANEILAEYQSYLEQFPPEEPEELPEITVMKVERPKSVAKIILILLVVVLLGGGLFFVKTLWRTIKNETIPQLKEPEPQNHQIADNQFQPDPNLSANQEQDVNQNLGQSQIQTPESNIEGSIEVNSNTDSSTDSNIISNADLGSNIASSGEKNSLTEKEKPITVNGNNTTNDILSNNQKTNTAQNTDSAEEKIAPVQPIIIPEQPVNHESQVTDTQSTKESETQEVESKTEQIQVIAEGNSWIRVQVDNEIAFQGQLKQGESRVFTGKKINLRIGNAEAVKVNYNGLLIGPFGGKNELVEKVFGE